MFDRGLTLKPKMERTWLIQRLQKPFKMNIAGREIDNPFSFGGGLKNGGMSDDAMKLLRELFSFDYMGSSEFEWGAVPNAIKFLAEQSSNNNLVASKMFVGKDEEVFYLCPKQYQESVMETIKKLREGDKDIRLKEHCGLREYFNEQKEYYKKNIGWLELDNGFAFFVDREIFEKFCLLLGVPKGDQV